MNTGILHAGRKHQSNDGGEIDKIPSDVLSAMANEMGVDISELKDQAKDIWAMLNDLHDSDYSAYTAFIKKQVKDAPQEVKKRKCITPLKGFATRAEIHQLNDSSIQKRNLFINFCHHDAIKVPHNEMGESVKNDFADKGSLEIPIIISAVRDIDNDKAVDVIVNPLVIKKSKECKGFRSRLISLGVACVEEDHNIKLSANPKIIKSTYKGGEGERNSTFPLHLNQTKEGQRCGDVARKLKAKTKVLDSPKTLLDAVKQASCNLSPEDDSPIVTAKEIKLKKPLIQEISSNPNVLGVPAENETKSKKTKKVPLRGEMRGFLNKSHQSLYASGSTGDGCHGTGGDYVKFMSKCQVVNIGGGDPQYPNEKVDLNRRDILRGNREMFSDSDMVGLHSKSTEKHNQKSNGFHDPAPTRTFEKKHDSKDLISNVDDSSSSMLTDLANLLSKSEPNEQMKEKERERSEDATELSPKTKDREDRGQTGNIHGNSLSFQEEVNDNGQVIEVDLSTISLKEISMKDIHMEISTVGFLLKICGIHLKRKFKKNIQEEKVIVKLSNKKKSLLIRALFR